MKNSYFLFSLLLILLNPVFSAAQKKFHDAKITTNDGSVIIGQVQTKAWNQPLGMLQFQAAGEDLRNYAIDEIQAFEVTRSGGDIVYFERKTVEIETSPERNNMLELDHSPELKYQRVTVWLELIYRGSWDLFFLMDKDGKSHYFLGVGDTPPIELANKAWLKNFNGKIHVQRVELFRKILLDHSQDCPLMFDFISNMKFSEDQFVLACKNYDQCIGVLPTYERKKEKGRFTVKALGGLSYAGVGYFLYFPRTITKVPGWQAGASIEYFLGGTSEHVSLFSSFTLLHFEKEKMTRIKPSDLYLSNARYDSWQIGLNLLASYRFAVNKQVVPIFRIGISKRIPVKEQFFVIDPSNGVKTDLSKIEDAYRLAIEGTVSLEYKKFGIDLRYSDARYISVKENNFSFLGLGLNYRIF